MTLNITSVLCKTIISSANTDHAKTILSHKHHQLKSYIRYI